MPPKRQIAGRTGRKSKVSKTAPGTSASPISHAQGKSPTVLSGSNLNFIFQTRTTLLKQAKHLPNHAWLGPMVGLFFVGIVVEFSDQYTNLAVPSRSSTRINQGQGGVRVRNEVFVRKTMEPAPKVTAAASAVEVPTGLEENSMAPPLKVDLSFALNYLC